MLVKGHSERKVGQGQKFLVLCVFVLNLCLSSVSLYVLSLCLCSQSVSVFQDVFGRCEGRCDVSVENRAYCKRCRMTKCLEMGMRREMLLSKYLHAFSVPSG